MQIMSDFEVVAWDWREPNVIAVYSEEQDAKDFAETMDASGLCCYVRPLQEKQTDE
jgi:hypothetical protein